jgi:hypothetical protein
MAAKDFDMLDGETPHAFQAFVCYRELEVHQQTLAEASRAFYGDEGKHPRAQICEWSRRNSWRKRARAYAQWKDEQKIEAMRSEIGKMARRHAMQAVQVQSIAARQANALLQKVMAAEKKAAEENKPAPLMLTVKEIMDLFKIGVQMERLSYGQPDSIQRMLNPTTRTGGSGGGGDDPADDELITFLLEDEEAIEHAAALFERISTASDEETVGEGSS